MTASRTLPASADVDDGLGRHLGGAGGALSELAEVIEHAAHLLPQQGPITVFIHHNTLHALEDLPFHEALRKGAQVFGCQTYLGEDRYRDELRRGRIRFAELQEVLEEDLGERAREAIPGFGTRMDLRLAMLQYPLRIGPTEELVWYVAEQDGLRRVRPEVSSAVRARLIAETRRWVMRDLRGGNGSGDDHGDRRPGRRRRAESLGDLLDRFGEAAIEGWSDADWESFTLRAMWRLCCEGVRDLPSFSPAPPPAVRHRDLLLEATGEDSDAPVHGVLLRFTAAFVDQGLASWPLPNREAGFYRAFCALYRLPAGPPDRWMRGLARELGRLDEEGVAPLESIRESLEILGVEAAEYEAFIGASLLALRGWAGMVGQLEVRGDRVVRPVPAGSLVEFLAVRLILERFALADAARRAIDYRGPLSGLRDELRRRTEVPRPPSVEQRAFLIYQLAQVAGLSADVLYHLGREQWSAIMQEIEAFSGTERRRIFHLAYERRFYTQALDAIALHARSPAPTPERPRFQAVFCLDEREESFRRHLEELAPEAETFGVAGFFAVAMYYRGAADAHFTALCPVVLRPQHWVTEVVGDLLEVEHRRRARTRRLLGSASRRFHTGSRSFAVGALLTGSVGVLASFPLVARILFPRLTARIRQMVGRIVEAPPFTRLQLERAEPDAGPDDGHVGYTVAEMTDVAARLLRDIGLTRRFARLLVLIGHGSNSQNNPHNSAYNCGACGGARGGPNARAMAQMLNDSRVRAGLARRGIAIPAETVVVAGSHNTCDDSVAYFDVERIPESHRVDFDGVRSVIAQTSRRNAHERCRRFYSAPLTISFEDALAHVEGRSEDLSQTRPELGHATNAITIVGRRAWSRGLFLDRRAFLGSYDPTGDDDEKSILAGVLAAVFPVCGGINLEYYFSHVDNPGWGAGTKLPHNLASLLGVMDGYMSDLRTGLPWQMVEIHEPVRSLFVIETTAGTITAIMDRNPMIGRMCRNGWIILALIHPETRELSVYQGRAFRPYRPRAESLPRASSSVDWYRGWREHLDFAEIGN
jgi:uncharacterized protein YbcC (UPF0753/DUF2309 family)